MAAQWVRHSVGSMRRWAPLLGVAAASLAIGLLAGAGRDGASATPPALGTVFLVGGSYESAVLIGEGAPATSGWLPVDALAVDAGGGVLAAGEGAVRRIGADGAVHVVAGTGRPGFSGDGGPAETARLSGYIAGLSALPDGGFLIFDAGNHRVRRVSPDGHISTVAGTGRAGAAGDGGPAIAAQLPANPGGFAAMPDGGFVLVDAERALLRRVHPDGTIATMATGVGPPFLAVRPDGTVLWSDPTERRVFGLSPDGRRATIAGTGGLGHRGDGGPATNARLTPGALSVTTDGSVLVADGADEGPGARVRRITPAGRIETVMGRSPRSVGIEDGSPEGLPAQLVGAGIGALAAAPDGGVYLTDVFADEIEGDHGSVDRPSTVLYVPGPSPQRLAIAATIAPSSPPNRFRVALTTAATVQTTLRRGGRVIARRQQPLRAGGSRTIALPAAQAGPYRIELRAVTGDGRADTRADTAYVGPRLTMRWGRRFARHYQRVEDRHPGLTVGRCRRFTPWRVDCELLETRTDTCRSAVAIKVERQARQAWLVARPYRCASRTRDHLSRHPRYRRFAPLDQASLADSWRSR
jgi:hypothetical protein